MKKFLTAAVAALTLGGAMAATATPAAADSWHGGYHGGYGGYHGGYGGYRGGYGSRGYGHRGYGGGAVVGAGLLGLAVGAAVAGSHPYYGRPYYDHYYYGPPPAYYAGPGYYTYIEGCRTYWRWDAYWGRYVEVQRCY
jgi:hypothetical protein